MMPYLYVIFLSDISITELLDKNIPVHISIWIHRISFILLLPASIAIFLLLYKVKYANYISSVVLFLFLIYAIYIAGGPPIEEADQVAKRLEYNDPVFGVFVERIVRVTFFIAEALLIYILVRSKRIKNHFIKENILS